jgi:hypothetical protein
MYGYDPETKVQLSQWKHSSSPRPKKSTTGAEQSQGAAVFFFFNYGGIVHHSYAPEGQTINREYYLEVIRHLRDGRDRTCGSHAIGNCIMTMPRLIHHT